MASTNELFRYTLTWQEKCEKLLRLTHDGNDLLPHELKRLENCINGFLPEAAMEITFGRYGV